MKNERPKKVIGFQAEISRAGSQGVRKLELRVRSYNVRDAAHELRDAIRRGNEKDQAYYLKLANAVQAESGDTRYLDDMSCTRTELGFRWQDDTENGVNNWYAGSVELRYADPTTFKLLARICKVAGHAYETEPRDLVATLVAKLHAIPATYSTGNHIWIPDQRFDIDAEIPPFVREPAQPAPQLPALAEETVQDGSGSEAA